MFCESLNHPRSRPCRRATYALVMTLALGVLAPGLASAVELHTFFNAHCERQTGALVHVDDEFVHFVDLDGHRRSLDRSQISIVVLHRTLEMPIAEITVDDVLAGYLHDVWVGNDTSRTFTGFATGFLDELMVFLDLRGNVHVLEPEEIKKVRSAAQRGSVKAHSASPARLAYPPALVHCVTTEAIAGQAAPTRVIADPIKVGNYLGTLADRYHGFEGFLERTLVYARPFLFDEKARFALNYFPDAGLPLPFYFRWSGGNPYRFQSFTVVGMSPDEWLPFARPTFLARSDVKSHFFRASFVGNLLALPAGNDPFFLETDPTTDEIEIGVSYNYLAIMGVDFWKLSFSAGPYYQALSLRFRGTSPLALTANTSSTAARVLYEDVWGSLRLLYFRSRDHNTPCSEDEAQTGDCPEFAIRTDAIRLGATIQLIEQIEVMADQILTIGDLDATTAMLDGTTTQAQLDFRHVETALMIAATFGRYVTVKGYAKALHRKVHFAGGSGDDELVLDPSTWTFIYGGGLEFLF